LSQEIFLIQKYILQICLVSIFLLFSIPLCQLSLAAQIRLAWDPNTERDLAGYNVYYGTASWSFGDPIKLRKVTTYTLTGLKQSQTYCIALKAYDWSRLDSYFSNQVCVIAHDMLYGEWVFDI